MSVHYDGSRQTFVVDWLDDGRTRTRRFATEADAVAFNEARVRGSDAERRVPSQNAPTTEPRRLPSVAAPSVQRVTEQQSAEVERVLLHVSDARERARVAAEHVSRQAGNANVVEALRETERTLDALHHRLTQRTLYAASDDETLKLAI